MVLSTTPVSLSFNININMDVSQIKVFHKQKSTFPRRVSFIFPECFFGLKKIIWKKDIEETSLPFLREKKCKTYYWIQEILHQFIVYPMIFTTGFIHHRVVIAGCLNHQPLVDQPFSCHQVHDLQGQPGDPNNQRICRRFWLASFHVKMSP